MTEKFQRKCSSSGQKLATYLFRQFLLFTFIVMLAIPGFGADPAPGSAPAAPVAIDGVSSPTAALAGGIAASDTGTTGPKEMELPPEAIGGGKEMLRVITLTPGGYLHYDEEKGTIYSPERTRVVYRGMELEADQLDFNTRVREVTASGNVVLSRPDSDVHADQMRYNFDEDEGVAFDAKARFKNVFISPSKKEKAGQPTFRRLGANEVIVNNSSATGCDFVIPHYRIRAREILVIPNERIFFRSATLYVREIPMFYFPFYSHSLREKSPWYVRLGYKSRIGGWVRLGYVYHHQTQVPSLENEKKLEIKSQGKLDVHADYLTKRGPGFGATYDYMFNYGRHAGESEFYYLDDPHRDIKKISKDYYDRVLNPDGSTKKNIARTHTTASEDTLQRYQVFLKHRSLITDDLAWIANIDWVSDPELYYDVLDVYRNDERQRVMERRARTALTWAREHYVARILLEVKDRIGRDRITNFSNPGDNDKDFDVDPDLELKKRKDQGIPTDRWGTASQKAPQIVVETAWLQLFGLPFYYHSDLNIFNNLDKGLNTVDGSDDAWVQGIDFYNSLMSRWRISPRYTALTKVGVGAGVAQRDKDQFDYFDEDKDFPRQLGEPGGGLIFTDPETFLIGEKEFNLNQVKPGFAYGDFMERLHARFSDSLTGDLIYRYRGTTKDNLGDWYARQGDNYVRSDLYNFRLRENNIEGVLRYNLAQPRLSVAGHAYRNLEGKNDLFPQELVGTYGVGAEWVNALRTLSMGPSINYEERQLYAPSDTREYLNQYINYAYAVNYRPVSNLWWMGVALGYRQQMGHDVGPSKHTLFVEGESYTDAELRLGGHVGPKWVSELSLRYDSRASSLREGKVTFKRDLHDALLLMMVGVKQDIYKATSSNDTGGQQLDFRVALQPKLPHGETPEGVPGISTLEDRTKAPEMEMAGDEAKTYQRH